MKRLLDIILRLSHYNVKIVIRYQQTEQPHFIAVIRDTENNLDNLGILVVLYPEAHRVNIRHNGGTHVGGIVAQPDCDILYPHY